MVDNAAEGGVIASLLYHPEYLLSDNNLQPKFFYNQDNQLLYWGINELVSSGITQMDIINLGTILNRTAGTQKIVAKYKLDDLQKYIEAAKNAARGTYEEYKLLANTVISLAFRRELCNLSEELGRECFNLTLSLDDLNDYANNGINKIAEKFVCGTDSVQFGEKIDDIWQEICNDRNDDGSFGIPNLIPSLDEFYTFGRGELVLVAGATGTGKSSFMLAQSMYALQRGVPCVFIDSELTDKVFLLRLLANLSGVPVRTIKSGQYIESENNEIKKWKEYVKKSAGFVHEYRPTFSKLEVDQICRKWYNKNKLGFLVYDYIKPSDKYGAAEISQSMGLIADYLKSVAGNLNIPVLAGLQLNRNTGQLADSFKTERYCDVLLYWKKKTPEQLRMDGVECGNYLIQVAKNRNGSLHGDDDYVDVKFIGDLMRISEAKKHDGLDATPFEQTG